MMTMRIKPHFIIDECDIERYLDFYQSALKLKDWDIVVLFSRDLGTNEAQVTYKQDRKQAIVTLLDHRFYTNEHFAYDMELALVHELIHIVLAPIGSDEYNLEEEKIVEQLAKTMVNLRRCSNIEV